MLTYQSAEIGSTAMFLDFLVRNPGPWES